MAAGGYSDDGAWKATVEFLDYETGQWVSYPAFLIPLSLSLFLSVVTSCP